MNRTTRFLVLSTVGLGAALTSIAAAQTPAPPAPRALLAGTFHGGGAQQRTAPDDAAPTGAPAPTTAAGAPASPASPASPAPTSREAEAPSERSRAQAVRAELLAAAAEGEMPRADAERVAADLAGYISGRRTFPESA